MYPPISERLSDVSKRRRERKASRTRSEFVKGPIHVSLIRKWASLPGKAPLVVGLVILFCRGLGRRDIKITPALLQRFGISRQAGYRGLAQLESAGLVEVERYVGKSPRVRLKSLK